LAVWAIVNGLDCRKCNSQLKKVRGCEGREEEIEIEGIKVNRCPMRMITGKTMAYIEAYHAYRSGFLPNPGGWLDQPIKFLEAMRVIEGAMERFGDEKSL